MQELEGKVYLVGGAVRDELLGLPVHEHDWVVVGSTPEEMLAAGFRQLDPEFPVFRHPQTGEEYALARRESKAGSGYRGFAIDASAEVTLQEDLRRRDLTINAIARDQAGQLIDPYDGRTDLEQGRLRHITPAFAEDPLRILRVARFAAKLGGLGFRLAHATHRLMKQMVADGAVAELLPQRTGRELNKALACEQPWRFIEVLHACGALAELAPGLAENLSSAGHGNLQEGAAIKAMQRACAVSTDPAVRFASLFLQTYDACDQLDGMLSPGTENIELLKVARDALETVRDEPDASVFFNLFQRLRAWHRGGRFEAVLQVIDAQPGLRQAATRLQAAREAAIAVSSEQLKSRGYQGIQLGQALAEARTHAIAKVLAQGGGG